ncbi:hypothetical protein SISNIDRAFT_458616 [Sistotremastrum niveocremeum HHB9708]|uniref:MYND-type domain-containing protein n=1 Tax=Sistotremastrum niveocremeum HHB9708 TaxID=1314777 RepID=A0A164QHQ8_9AGAM|nr:hypothetical protein SISNIDRAFT_458616 [Sistotremastrum niveocremeum HHB9708]
MPIKIPNFRTQLEREVWDRLHPAKLAHIMNAFMGEGFAAKGAVKTANPPIKDGMVYTLNLLKKIITEDYDRGRRSQLSLIPTLLLRIRALFRIYYNWQVTEERTADLKYCDFDDVGDVSIPLHELGLTLQLDRRRLKAVIDAGGAEFERVVLDMAPDIGPWREAAMNYEDELRKSEEADDGDRDDAQDLQDKADEDLAAYATVWFYGDLHVAFIMGTPTTEDEKRRAKKALKRLVFWSCNKKMRLIFGDCLTDSMRSIYGTPELLVKFCQVGGLAALIGDCNNSACKGLCENAALSLPDAAWDRQTKRSLFDATQSLQELTEWHDNEKHLDIFTSACYNIYKRYGAEPFERAYRNEDWSDPVIFHYIARQLKKEGVSPKTKAEWRGILRDYENLPRAVEDKYRWSNLNVSGQWDCIEIYGCDNDDCPEQAELIRLREARVKGVRDAQVEERLDDWGRKLKSCACHSVAYCSTDCQKAAWRSHKPKCNRGRQDVIKV